VRGKLAYTPIELLIDFANAAKKSTDSDPMTGRPSESSSTQRKDAENCANATVRSDCGKVDAK